MFRHRTALIAMGLWLLSTNAIAQTNSRAKARYEEGLKLFDEGNYGAAADAFGDAYTETRNSKHLWNLALAEYRAARIWGSLEHLRKYVDASDATPVNVSRAQTLIEELKLKVGRLAIKTDPGVEVVVDSRTLGNAPLNEPVEVDPDKAHLIVVRRGGPEMKREIAAPGPREVEVSIFFPQATPTLEPDKAALLTPPAPEPTPSNTPPVASWILAGVSAAALASGIVFSLDSRAKHEDVESRQSQCADPISTSCASVRNMFDAANRSAWIGVASYGVSAISLGAALLLWHPWSRKSARHGGLHLDPALSRQHAGLQLRLGF